MIEYSLNIIGSEWMIIIFVALILLFGTNKLPEAGLSESITKQKMVFKNK